DRGRDAVVGTVDAASGASSLAQHWEARKQAAIADRLLITKSDIAAGDGIEELTGSLRQLNPVAPIHRVVHGDIEPGLMFGAGISDSCPQSRRFSQRRGCG